MKFQKFMLTIAEVIGNFLHRDTMKYRIARYRLAGAQVGENVRAFSAIYSAEPYLICVGDNVTLSSGVKFITHDNSAIKLGIGVTDFVGPISIGNNCFVGMNAILMPGVSVADNCIVGAGAVVTKSVTKEGSIVAGNPAVVVGNVEQLKKRRESNGFNFQSCTYEEKKTMILDNQQKWLRK